MHKIFHSRLFLLSLLVLIALSLTALVREVSSTFRVKKEIARLESQAAELESRNQELKKMIEYLNSSSYKEMAARENLNLQAAGEVAVALPGKNEGQSTAEPSHTHGGWMIIKWWNYFFQMK